MVLRVLVAEVFTSWSLLATGMTPRRLLFHPLMLLRASETVFWRAFMLLIACLALTAPREDVARATSRATGATREKSIVS